MTNMFYGIQGMDGAFVDALDKDGNPWLWGSEPDDPFDLAPATHWMPLPEPPKILN